jgi:hypothetical protein
MGVLKMKYYVVLEVECHLDILSPADMANWIDAAMRREADGLIDVTVYDEFEDLRFDVIHGFEEVEDEQEAV